MTSPLGKTDEETPPTYPMYPSPDESHPPLRFVEEPSDVLCVQRVGLQRGGRMRRVRLYTLLVTLCGLSVILAAGLAGAQWAHNGQAVGEVRPFTATVPSRGPRLSRLSSQHDQPGAGWVSRRTR